MAAIDIHPFMILGRNFLLALDWLEFIGSLAPADDETTIGTDRNEHGFAEDPDKVFALLDTHFNEQVFPAGDDEGRGERLVRATRDIRDYYDTSGLCSFHPFLRDNEALWAMRFDPHSLLNVMPGLPTDGRYELDQDLEATCSLCGYAFAAFLKAVEAGDVSESALKA